MRRAWLLSALLRLAALGVVVVASTVRADDLTDRFDFHGFGNQDYAQTSANTYLGADTRGTWDENFLGLVMSVSLSDRAKVWAQLETSTLARTQFTWFFLDYQFTDSIEGHIGRVRLPLGLYNEIVDSTFLQLSLLQPSLYQQSADFVHDSYQGVGVDYQQSFARGGLLWQGYFGNISATDPDQYQVTQTRDRHLVGGRVTYTTSVTGLRFMVSAYDQWVENETTSALHEEKRVIFSADYTNGPIDVKAEYGEHSLFGVDSRAYYLQAGYTFGSKWTPYLRYDDVITNDALGSDASYFQRTVVTGIGYRIDDHISVRLENHFNHGYGLAVASREEVAGSGALNWNMTIAGVAFAF